ncbi:sodium:solute symporter family protein [Dethiobacter alkaliphilus]|uniref:sodium:solute symporter family protein n=1 Tax=Dethiobacter alkaliphilus TaxID=427926 RepID=UPI002225E341|nr:sodium:solute symporter family protein [Dethiobacter alkaliphilus]MCW3489198.1 sodium:solute symporter family protein [Dethiobacter alkaliphilus]
MNLGILTAIFAAYLGILIFFAYTGFKQTQSADDYLVAGRNVHPWVMALSYGAAFISTSAIIGFGGVAGMYGFSLLWLAFLNIILGVWIAFAFLGTKIRKMSAQLEVATFPSLLGSRYQSRFITVFAGMMIFVFMPAYTSIILIGGARFLQEAFLLNFNTALLILAVIVTVYVLTGGLKAVMYTDAFCASVMFLGMIALLIGTYNAVGGVVAGHRGLTALNDLVPESLTAMGHQGWTAMPQLGSPLWWTIVSTIIMGVGIGVLAQPQLAMRFMTVKENKSLYRAVMVGSVFIFFLVGTVYMVGPLSNLYFYNTQGIIAADVAQGNIDLIIPAFISSFMPEWFLYLFTLTLISAAISTLSALIHVQGTAFGRDILETMGVQMGKKGKSARLPQLGVMTGVVLAVTLAYILPGSIIARATAFWFGICAAGFLPTLVGALYWQRGTRLGAIASMVSGFSVSIFGFVFLHIAESEPFGIAMALFGRHALLPYPWTHVDPLLYALPVSAAMYIGVSLLTAPPAKEHLKRCF